MRVMIFVIIIHFLLHEAETSDRLVAHASGVELRRFTKGGGGGRSRSFFVLHKDVDAFIERWSPDGCVVTQVGGVAGVYGA